MFESRYAHRNITQIVSHSVSHPAAETAHFTRTAAAMVARNDRRAWLRQLGRVIRRRAQVAGLGWSALVLIGFVVVLLPVNMRVA